MKRIIGVFLIFIGTVTSTYAQVMYEVVFESTWSRTTHPTNFPSSGHHFTSLIGATHNNSLSLWAEGETVGVGAASGMESMAEVGGTSALRSSVEAAITAGTAKSVLSGGGIGSAAGTVKLTFAIHSTHTRVTLVSMIAPSSDWFIGVGGLNLWENGGWVPRKVVALKLYDAGTEQDDTPFVYNNPDQSPKQPISLVTHSGTDFRNGAPALGTFTFTLKAAAPSLSATKTYPIYLNPQSPEATYTGTPVWLIGKTTHEVYGEAAVGRVVTAYSSGALSGTWQYRRSFASGNWMDMPALSSQYLPLAPSYYIRFLPDRPPSGFTGAKPTLTLRPWDRTRGSAGTLAAPADLRGSISTTDVVYEAIIQDPASLQDSRITTLEKKVAALESAPPSSTNPSARLRAIETRSNNQSDSLERHDHEIKALEATKTATETRNNNQSDSLERHDNEIQALEARQSAQDTKIAALEAEIESLKGSSTTTIYHVPQAKKKENVRPYPNPTARQLQFAGLAATRSYIYKIYAPTGILLLSGTVQRSDSINISALAEGSYTLTLHTEEGEEVLQSHLIVK